MKIRFLVVGALLILFTGCATQVSLHPQSLEGQSFYYNSGTEMIKSEKENAVAVGLGYQQLHVGGRADLLVVVENKTKKTVEFSSFNIVAKSKEQNLHVYSYEELAAEIEKKRRNEAIAAALGAFSRSLNASQAGYQTHSGTFNTYGSGNFNSYGSNYSYGTYSGSATTQYYGKTYSPYLAQKAQAEANAQNQKDFENLKQNYNERMAEINGNILRRNSVLPNTIYGGIVRFDLPKETKNDEINVDVSFGDETHTFRFNIMKVSSK